MQSPLYFAFFLAVALGLWRHVIKVVLNQLQGFLSTREKEIKYGSNQKKRSLGPSQLLKELHDAEHLPVVDIEFFIHHDVRSEQYRPVSSAA